MSPPAGFRATPTFALLLTFARGRAIGVAGVDWILGVVFTGDTGRVILIGDVGREGGWRFA